MAVQDRDLRERTMHMATMVDGWCWPPRPPAAPRRAARAAGRRLPLHRLRRRLFRRQRPAMRSARKSRAARRVEAWTRMVTTQRFAGLAARRDDPGAICPECRSPRCPGACPGADRYRRSHSLTVSGRTGRCAFRSIARAVPAGGPRPSSCCAIAGRERHACQAGRPGAAHDCGDRPGSQFLATVLCGRSRTAYR